MLKERLQEDLQKGLREGRNVEVSTLRMVLAAVLNKEKVKRAKLAKENPQWGENELSRYSILSDEETIEVLMAEAKKRKEAIIEFEKGNRQDLVEKEREELELIQKYLPEQLPEDEIRKLVKEAIQKTGASGSKDMGKVMAELMPRIKGRAEGNLVSKLVKELLEG